LIAYLSNPKGKERFYSVVDIYGTDTFTITEEFKEIKR
jgi:hypothetical protein